MVEEVDLLVVRGAPLLVPQQLLQAGMTEALPLLQRDFGLMMELKTELTFGYSSAAFENHRRNKGMFSLRFAFDYILKCIFDSMVETHWAMCSKCCSPSESEEEAPAG